MGKGRIPPPKIIALVICDNVYVDATGKQALIGLFNRIFATDFPAIHPKLCVFVSLTSVRPQKRCKLEILDIELDRSVVEIEGTFPANSPTQICDLVFELAPVTFPKAGTYHVRFSSENETLVERPIEVLQVNTTSGNPGGLGDDEDS